MTNLTFWFREQRALVRHLSDAHRAIAVLQRRVRFLEGELKAVEFVNACPGREEHVRLAARAERSESLAGVGSVVPLRAVPLRLVEPRGGDGG